MSSVLLMAAASLFLVTAWLRTDSNAASPAKLSKQVVVLHRPVPRGHVIAAGDLTLVFRPIYSLPRETLTKLEDVVGARTAVALPAGYTLVPTLFDTHPHAARRRVPGGKGAVKLAEKSGGETRSKPDAGAGTM